ncbi:MAG: T9SS type A sorting domain-containing protein, partial [Candidatus Cloacimonetes bacterium]|nr:T9SS type A sorting domain-containing protein [Candidatus Cloacimonadota bacterium]
PTRWQTDNIEIRIYNVKGQLVKNFELRIPNSEFPKVVWDGKDENGKPVSSGIYLYKIKSGNFTATKKMIMMK